MLVWTTKTPTEVGWYWKHDLRPRMVEVQIVYVRLYVDKLCIENWPIPTKNTRWAGPMSPPTEPLKLRG